MSDMLSVPIAVVSKRPDDAEAISQTLRNAGCIAHCISIQDSADLAEVLTRDRPVLLFVFEKDTGSQRFANLMQQKNTLLPDLSVLVVQAQVSEESIAAAMEAGADDLISLGNKARLQTVARREINHCHQARLLRDSEQSALQLESQLESLVKESPDALMHIHEGIVIAVNPAWRKLLGYAEEDDIIGTPALDAFDDSSQAAFKGALVACVQENWSGHELSARAKCRDGTNRPVTIEFERAIFDDEPCIRLSLQPDKHRDRDTPRQIVSESPHHPLTGFYRRQRFLSEMEARLQQRSRGGVWVLAYMKLDNIQKVREQLGPISSDDLLLEFAQMLQEHARKNDLYGQFGGDLFMMLMQRGTLRDATAWAENLRTELTERVFEIDQKSFSVTITIGLAVYRTELEDIADLVIRAQKSYQKGLKRGGNQIVTPNLNKDSKNRQATDEVYVRQIKAALMGDGFRLVYQPVASLENQSLQVFDALLRMVDESNRELMPNMFLPAARRNGLMKNIDRWVIMNAIKFCKLQSPGKLFVRLSYDSIPDLTLIPWLEQQIAAAQINPSQLVLEVTEIDAENHLKEVKQLATGLKEIKCCVAVEHFGVGSHPLQLLGHLPLDFIKIDGSLMEALSTDQGLQTKVKSFVDAAREKGIATVAERVEDANTMAVLWQIGLQYIQGFYVQGPEEIVLES